MKPASSKPPRRPYLKKWTPVEVTWHDIYSIYGDVYEADFDNYAQCIRKSLGYVVVDKPDRMVLVHTDDRLAPTDTEVADALVIPRGVIMAVKKLYAKDK